MPSPGTIIRSVTISLPNSGTPAQRRVPLVSANLDHTNFYDNTFTKSPILYIYIQSPSVIIAAGGDDIDAADLATTAPQLADEPPNHLIPAGAAGYIEFNPRSQDPDATHISVQASDDSPITISFMNLG